MVVNILVLIISLVALVYAADYFVSGAVSIAKTIGVSSLVIGLTIVGLGTSAPEILVSGISSLQGNAGLAVGNALGSNIANIGMVLGITAIIAPIAMPSGIIKRELPILMVISIACYLLAFDGLGQIDGVMMLMTLVVFIGWLIKSSRGSEHTDDFSGEFDSEMTARKAWIVFFLGLLGLLVSSKLLVWSAVNIAQYFGISDLVIGLSIVAVGTSLPELAASVMSVIKKEGDLALGNIIGSNIYNLLAVYSLPGLLAPNLLDQNVLYRDFPVMLFLTGVLFVFGYKFFKKIGSISRLEGIMLMCFYVGYQWVIF
ncbi:MAG TPA: calcium/sodium antiporter [Methylococcaceae bacterium]|jgi:cation:H+ antiporter|nr:calcium/sodium antiporter [Methylococcaceae bacterium]HIL40226.1 calcium/sodium antiporter [Methylococcales bacterium]